MANVDIKALISFSDGNISVPVGGVASVPEADATDYIAGGLAEAYTEPIVPEGKKTIDENGTYDVTEYASVEVNVSGGGK